MVDLAGHDWKGFYNDVMTVSASSYYGSTPPYYAMVTSSFYWLTNGTSTGWWKIDFGPGIRCTVTDIDIVVNSVPEPNRAPKDFTIQGSNNDVDWDVLLTVTGETSWGSGESRNYVLTTTGAYRYYKINITANNGDSYLQLGEVYFWGTRAYMDGASDEVTHDWTGLTNGGMTVSASSYHPSFPPYQALDETISQTLYFLLNGTTGWWEIDLGSGNAQTLKAFILQANYVPEPARMPKDFTIQGSNNDVDWDVLLTVTGQTDWLKGETRLFLLSSYASYQYYKIDITANNGDGGYTQLGEVYLYILPDGWPEMPITVQRSSMFLVFPQFTVQ